ncbi:acyl-CoA dehydrogenase [Sphingobacterium sp. LRF_L2]|uniref:acyl-CoA dehydrogenase n=1 Tax=Sphingobacterium sp. LRF_L2 TaxID=3369421 RepID=UPI003F5DA8D7
MLSNEHQTIIKDNIRLAISQKCLTSDMLKLVYSQKWFNLWVPKAYGGLASNLAAGCHLLEELAYIDGGFGWTVTLCAGANMFAGFIDPALATTLFQNPNVCWGGSGQVTGRAERADNGFLISGQWKYATGAPHLTHFTLNAWIYENGQQVYDEQGKPIYYSFFVNRDDVLIHYDWDTFGLECTASHSFSITKLFVTDSHVFELIPEKRTHQDILFSYPFAHFAECTLAVNYLGMFFKFLDLLERYFFIKATDKVWNNTKGKSLFKQIDGVRQSIEKKKEQLYALMVTTWNDTTSANEELADIANLSRIIVAEIKKQTIELFPQAGIMGAQRESELNIVFRHLFTASQHALLNT